MAQNKHTVVNKVVQHLKSGGILSGLKETSGGSHLTLQMCECGYRGRQHGASEPDGVTLHVMCDDLNFHRLRLQTHKHILTCGCVEPFRLFEEKFVRVV